MGTINKRDVLKILKNNGYVFDHQTGSHSIYKNGKRHMAVNVNKCNKMIMQRLIKEYNLKV